MSNCNCPSCYKRRGWEAPGVTTTGHTETPSLRNDAVYLFSLDAPVPSPRKPMPESLLDDLVGEAVGCLAMFREPEYGGHPISDEDLKARARNLIQGLQGLVRMERLK